MRNNMIGNPKWFDMRKYSGWGLRPKTWQGWVYVLAITIPSTFIWFVPNIDNSTRGIIFFIMWLLFSFDIIDLMVHIKKDEREHTHEAIAERNASWSMVLVLTTGMIYQLISSYLSGNIAFDPWLIVALLVGAVVKLFSYRYWI